MNQVLTERYTLARLRWIGAVGVTGAVIAFLAGNREIAVGALAATPVGMFNYYLMVRAMRAQGLRPQAMQARILKFSLVRMFLSVAALFAAFAFGPYVMLGALIGVTSEMFTYMGDTLRLIRSMRGDR